MLSIPKELVVEMWRGWPWDQRIIPRVPPPPKHLPANTRFGMADSGTALGIWVRAGICGFGAPASERTVLTLRTSPCAMAGILHREALDLPISKAGKWRNRAHTPSTTPGKELLNEFSSLPSTSVRFVRFPFPVGPFQNFNTEVSSLGQRRLSPPSTPFVARHRLLV